MSQCEEHQLTCSKNLGYWLNQVGLVTHRYSRKL